MSVVNKMLQDLEDRKAEPEYSADYQPSNNKKASIVGLYIAAVVVLLASASWFFKDHLFSQSNSIQNQPQITDNTIKNNQQQPIEERLQPQELIDRLVAGNSNESAEPELEPQKPSQQSKIDQADTSAQTLVEQANPTPEPQAKEQMATQSTASAVVAQTTDKVQDTVSDSLLSAGELPQTNNFKSATNQPKPSDIGKIDPSAGVFEMKSSEKVVDKDELKQQVQIALKRGDDRSAISLLTKLVEVTPDNTTARKRLAAMLFAKGNHTQADQVIQQGIELVPDNLELRLMQARLYDQVKKPMQGFELLMAFPVSAAQAPDYIAFRAALAQKVANFEQAKLDYYQLVKSQSANAKWWLGLAVVEERLGNMLEALEAYRHVKQLSQMSVEVEEFVDQRIRYLAEVK